MTSGRRTALITGVARGIGLGIAKCLAAEGWAIAGCGVRPEADVTDAMQAIADLGAETLYCQADISDAASRERLLDAVRRRFGGLHLLVNNAGVAPLERLDVLETTEESYERVMRINLQGPFFLTQAVARWMIQQKGEDAGFQGAIVNVSSISSTVVSPNRGEYCMSKAGVSMATQLWAVRMAPEGIPVYEVRPGVIRTDMTSGVTGKYDRLIEEEGLCLQPRWGTPDDVGKAVAMLARGDLPYSTGQILMVDGGLTVQTL